MNQKSSTSFWLVGYSLFLIMVGTNLPSPLYAIYKSLWGFSSGILTLVFAVYALMIIPSLLLFGQLSDRFGRKKILLPGLIVAALGSVLFAFANNVEWLFIARAVQGLAVGIVSGAATAALFELHPNHDRKLAALVASVGTAGGTALGPLLAGILVQYLPWGPEFPFIIHLFLIVPGIAGLFFIPETVQRKSFEPWRWQKPSIPAEIRAPFAICAATAFISFAVAALFMSLVPSYVGTLMHESNLALSGGAVFVMLGASSAVQLGFKRLGLQAAQIIGLVLLVIGLAGVVLAVPLHSLLLLLVSTVIAGAGQGLAFMGSMGIVSQIVPTERRGDVLSSFYVVIYCGVGIPILGVGFGAQWFGLFHAFSTFAYSVAILGTVMILVIGSKRNKSQPLAA